MLAEAEEKQGASVRGVDSGAREGSLPPDKHHLGIFTDRKGTYLCLQQEGRPTYCTA